ncbi:MAG: RecX family transcriptional regulator, partial [Bacteroidota bacterium]|nr:RecX family transcriptional regulator [Bacteroidota bacterium]
RTADELEEQKIQEIQEYDEYEFGKKIAYSFLAYKSRSRKEIIKKLSQKKISSLTIEKITDLLEKQKYVDDKMYAKNYLENKLTHKPVGKRLARLKLLEKGIEKEIAENIIDENYSGDKEFDLAGEILKKYQKKVKYKDAADKKNKCYRHLISKGFDYEVVSRLLSV